MELTTTVRGKPKLCLDGYAYTVDKKVDSRVYWKCERYDQCRGRVVTIQQGQADQQVRRTQEHNHAPDSTRVEVLRENEALKRMATRTTTAPVQIPSSGKYNPEALSCAKLLSAFFFFSLRSKCPVP
ncbi:hypothetical protein HPB48_005724 [Haemaphysalis longicornis]|uniref:FLYWCH-type domain-containing protein n=1 Tax=Haemaphysalis longicornis TaxID=44386 RepID=A0A9J6FCD1_HAELO|nr:hypothetical protein HPB48_005724 [Haemaphysalis longicornis]